MTAPVIGRVALLVVTLTLLTLALLPSPPSDGLGWDKANHAVAMAVVTVAGFLAFRPSPRAVAFGAAYALALGVLIELLQGSLTSSRSAEWGDLLADLVGIVVAAIGLGCRQRGRDQQ